MTHYWFISKKYRRNAKLALVTFALAFVVILLGAYTRLTNAGLSCPDWPNCYGFLTAPHTAEQLHNAAQHYPLTAINVKKAWTEMAHRYAAGIEGLLILILSLSILFNRGTNDFKSTVIGFALMILLIIQITLGMLTVTEKLRPVIVLAHLLTGLSLLSVLWWTYLDLHWREHSFVKHRHPGLFLWLWLALMIMIVQIILGGWVSTHYAGLACIDFPYCNGQLLPHLQWSKISSDLITIHMLHRIGAVITASYLALLALYLWQQPAFRSIASLLLALLLLQITLGIFNIIWLRPVWIALMHQAVAILLLLTVITTLVKASFTTGHSHGFWIT